MYDHSLNDWKYQVKNNFYTLSRIAKEWSYNYKYHITWKVTDGWFSYPRLYIKRGSEYSWTRFYNFNWGDKV